MKNTYKTIFTNGVFDIIHPGHINMLKFARELGDVLMVGINSDWSVRKIKGINRPINPSEDRVAVLRAIRYVDHVFLFNDPTPIKLIKNLKPNIIVKGSDYQKEEVVGYGLAEIYTYPISKHSTSAIIEKVRGQYV